jgi:hypothetical protein
MNRLIIIIIIGLVFYSCKKKDEKLFYKIEGIWSLEQLTYKDSLNSIHQIDTIGSSITFVNCKKNTDNEISHCDLIQSYNGNKLLSEYYISINDKLNIITYNLPPQNLPLYVLGNRSVYNVIKLTRKEIILQVESAFIPVSFEKVTDLNLYFVK